MKRSVVLIAIFVAFAVGHILGLSRPHKRSEMDAFKDDVRQYKTGAAISVDALEKLQSGDEKAVEDAAIARIASYYATYRQMDDPTPFQQDLVHRIEALIAKSEPLKRAIEEEKASGAPDILADIKQKSGK
jgi:hypothetical protein